MNDVDEALERHFWPAPRPGKARKPRFAMPSQSGGRDTRGGLAVNVITRAELAAHLRRAPQVLVKITGGSRGMAGITAHLRYISHDGERPVEDQGGQLTGTREELDGMRREWRDAGARLPWVGDRKEAHHILFQMPAGTPSEALQDAVRAFARTEFAGHRYAMALHVHQSTPHVHLIVRTEDPSGHRLNPRKDDLHRWRLRFANELRERGVDAAASRQRTRGYAQRHEHLWEKKLTERVSRLRSTAERADAIGDDSAAAALLDRAFRARRFPATSPRARDPITRAQEELAMQRWALLATRLTQSLGDDDRSMATLIRRAIGPTDLVSVRTPEGATERLGDQRMR